jgi:hypothetical protein
MKKAVWSALTAVALLACATTASAQTTLATQPIDAIITVGNQARLIVTGPVTFADQDPDVVGVLVAAPVSVTARARVQPTDNLTVTVVAADDYFDPTTQTIPVGGMSWSSTGTGFVTGTMSAATPQTVGAFVGPSNNTGTQTYSLPNLWTYAPGTHTVVLTYTLTVQ